MASEFSYVWDIMIVALFLSIAALLEKNIRFFHKFLIPNAIVAGFIGLLLGPQLLNLVQFNADHLGVIVYHLMSVGFIALTLKERKREKNNDVINTGFFIVSTYVLQGIVGFGLSLLMVFTFFPHLFPAFGMLLPLGYGQGAAQAFSMGKQWETAGFTNGGNIGLFIAAMGLLWACLGGIPLMNYLIKVKKILPSHSVASVAKQAAPVRQETGEDEQVDKFTVQLFLIGVIYLVTYLTLLGLSSVLNNLGTFGITLANMLWGFSFIVATVYAIIFRTIYDGLKSKKIVKAEITNDFLLDRIAGGAFDFMITASIAAISMTILKEYLVPSLVIGIVGGFITIWYTIFICKRIYATDKLENILALYGTLTGIVSTGLALVKEIDPNFESSATSNLVLGSGAGLFVGLPLMLLLTVPIIGITTHQPIMFLFTMLALIVYFVVLLVLMYLKRPFNKEQSCSR